MPAVMAWPLSAKAHLILDVLQLGSVMLAGRLRNRIACY
jgi:hypothetical protein